MKAILNKLFNYENLSESEAKMLFFNIAEGKYNQSQLSSLMTVYLMRNISTGELNGFKNALLELKKPVDFGTFDYIDIVGTGGDNKNTFNISSCSSVVVAASGYKVVKHGNYGATSVSGASNVMENHGVKFCDDNSILNRSFDECNLAYLHAPMFNSAMKAVATARKELGVRTFFNLLGPLINPATPKYQLLGVFNLAMQRLYSYMFQQNNREFAVVHSLDGYDEISLTSKFKVLSSAGEKIYTPEELGFNSCKESDIFGGESAQEAAKIFYSVLDNSSSEPQKNCVIANSAFAIKVMDSQKSIEECISIAKETIESGKAIQCFKRFIEINS